MAVIAPKLLQLRFQSSPPPKERSYAAVIQQVAGGNGFNPLRPRRSGATDYPCSPLISRAVSILSAPEGAELQSNFDIKIDLLLFQSSPPPKERSYNMDTTL